MTAQWVSSFRTAYERLQARRPLCGSGQTYREEPLVAPTQERQPQTAASLRRWLYAIPVSLVVVLTAALLVLRLAPGGSPNLRTAPADLLPGGVIRFPSGCTRVDRSSPDEIGCVVSRSYPVYLVYNRRERVISYTSYQPGNVTLGDLVLAWGAPDSYLYPSRYRPAQVFWGVKAAMTSSSLRATSPVIVVSHYRNALSLPAGRCAWRGLVSTESTDCPVRTVSTPIPPAEHK